MNSFSASPVVLARVLTARWSLIVDLTRRDALGRYKNSMLGVLWSLVTPIAMLIVYTFVFSTIFNVRWAGGSGSKTEFAVILFAGLIVFNVFAECVTKAPSVVTGNANLVKKVVFPLEVLPVVTLLSSLVHAAIALAVLLLFQLLFTGRFPVEALLAPILLVPYFLFVLGLTWFISALAVYVRDVSQTIGVVVTMLMFLSPLFFPASALPADWRILVHVNPLALPIEQFRDLVVWGRLPDASAVAWGGAFGAITAWAGYAWFQNARRGFADVL
jgi:lipopolysaccharide transport system permease protein